MPKACDSLSSRTTQFVLGSRFPAFTVERLDTMEDHQLRLSFKMDTAAIREVRAVAAGMRNALRGAPRGVPTVRQHVAEMVATGRLKREHIPADYDRLIERLGH